MSPTRNNWMSTSLTAILVVLLIGVSGCSGMKPFGLHNNREEGPEKGLFTGPQGEFVIYQGGGSMEVGRQEIGNDQKDKGSAAADAP